MQTANNAECTANMISGCWIASELAKDKGDDFAQMVISSDRWAFPRVTIAQAQSFLANSEPHCRCSRCRPHRPSSPPAPSQLSLF
jgi:hypothetical protein